MFWDKWIPKKYFVKTEACAVEACFGDEGIHFYYSCLSNKKNKLELEENGTLTGKPLLPARVGKNKIPVLLVITGKGVILKKINTGEQGNPGVDEIIRQNMPAINTSEFYVQLYRQEDSTAFIALCRKEQVNNLIQSFNENKYEIAALHLGVPAVIGLKPLWSQFNTLNTSTHQVELSNNNIDTLNGISAPVAHSRINIDTLSFSSEHTLGLASGLAYFMQRPMSRSEDPEIQTFAATHLEKNKFRFLMISVVALAFMLAVINVIFYTSYFDRNNKLESELSVYQGKYEKINNLLSEYQKNKNLIENAGVLNKNKLSEFADKIGITLPDEVVLSELYFNPKKESEDSEDSLVTFETRHITLKGTCGKSFTVNELVNVLKMQKFVKEVSLEKFIYNSDGIVPNFEIKLVTQ